MVVRCRKMHDEKENVGCTRQTHTECTAHVFPHAHSRIMAWVMPMHNRSCVCAALAYLSTPPPPYGVLLVARCHRHARKLSKTKSSSVVPEAPFGRKKNRHLEPPPPPSAPLPRLWHA